MSRHDPLTGEIPDDEKPISELFRLKGIEWVEAHKRYKIYDDSEKPKLAQMKQRFIDECRRLDPTTKVTDAAAERHVFASEEWTDYINHRAELDATRRLLELEKDTLQMRHEEEKMRSANMRNERYLSRG